MEYKLNYVFENEDTRDKKYTNIRKDINTTRIFSLDITKFKIYNQGILGSCVSNSIAGCIQYYNNTINPSRLYIYFNGRASGNTHNIIDDVGFGVRDGLKSVFDYSCCNEIDWIYDVSAFSKMPTLNCYKNSFNFNNFMYYIIYQELSLLKSCLIGGNPIIFGFIVYTSFMSDIVAKTGRVPMPSSQDFIVSSDTNEHRVLGGHSALIIGYNDNEQVFKCVNSWGTSWGENGTFTIPYQYILNPSLSSDFWMIQI